jgi:hypothetical protein
MYIAYGYGRYGNMNIMYLSLYGVAAVVLVVVFIRTCLERDKMTRIVCLTEMLALICVVTYSVNFITDNYKRLYEDSLVFSFDKYFYDDENIDL